ncbi:MAG: hypothetical protein U5R06_24150 [candidate division KSB1 bacterium]|nr:hypothetical protein [candidate division KSB1 bacterium]
MTGLDYTIVVVYLTAIVFVGMMAQKRASAGIDSYFLGNRGLPWWALGASGMASNLDVAGTMVNTAWVFALGAAGLFLEIRGGATLIMAFLMIFMGKWNRRSQVMTMAEWMRFRFGKGREGDLARLISAISTIVITIAMITYMAIGSGKFISTFLGFPDLGTVKDFVEQTERVELQDSWAGLESMYLNLDEDIRASRADIPEIGAVKRIWEDTDQAFTQMMQDPASIQTLKDFNDVLNRMENGLTSLSRAAEDTEQAAELVPRIQAAFELTKSIRLDFSGMTDYRILLKAETLAAMVMIFLAMIYTVASGLYGVVWTDVFQGLIIFFTVMFVCMTALFKFGLPEVFNISIPMRDGTFQIFQMSKSAWTHPLPPWNLGFPEGSLYSVYNLFGIAILFYLVKVTFEGAGGATGYMIQRYFAARSDREAGLLSLFWTFLLSFRWPFITAIAIMGISYGTSQGVISDPERVLPVVVNELIPVGIKGLLVAGLMAAAMSTFDSTVNAGAAYWVKDIYQAYINPKASDRALMLHSRWASIVIVILGLLFSLTISNINEIWGWITMSIGAGLIVPSLVRWYWWRMNGYGFAVGTAVGMTAAIVQRLIFPHVPEYVSFSFASGLSFLGMIIATYATKPTSSNVLLDFYKTTRSFGFWGPVKSKLAKGTLQAIKKENKRDIISIFMAVPWQMVLFLTWMMVIMREWTSVGWLALLLAGLSVGLYFSWFRHLSAEVKVED